MSDADESPTRASTSAASEQIFQVLVVDLAVSVHIPNLLQGMTTGIRSTLIPVFVRMLGASDAVVGLVTAAAGFARIIVALPAGVATQRVGVLAVMTIGMAVNIAGGIIGAVSFSWEMLAFASAVWGVAIGLFYVSRHVFLANVVGRQRRGRLMSLVGGGERWASVFGPVLGGLIIDLFGPRAAAAAIVPLSMLCVMAVHVSGTVRRVNDRVLLAQHVADVTSKVQTNDEAARDESGVVAVLMTNWSSIARIGLYAMNVIVLRTCRRMMLPLAAMNLGLSPTYVGLVLATSFAVDATLFFLGGMIMDRFGRRYAAVPTTVNLGLGFLLLASVETVWGVFMSAIFFGFADSLGAGLLLTLTADHVPSSGGPTYIGILRTVQDAGQLLGPVIAGAIIGFTSFPAACIALGVIGVLNGVWAYAWLPDEKKSFSASEERGGSLPAHDPCPTTILSSEVDSAYVQEQHNDGELDKVVGEDITEIISARKRQCGESLEG
jgi:MFS family permease